LTPERWQRVQELFLAAADLPPVERAALLQRECGGDPELHAEVARMLAADGEPEPLLDAPPLAAVPGADLAGRGIGPYRIVRELGRGGMGAVYLAERDDVGKRVALKLVRGVLAAPDNIKRFLLERRVLARLEHPSIARLLDAGITDDGLPYFAMEHVEGEPIDHFCDERRLPLRARLELVTTVCDAVAYAHRNLIVHRDLKPANILVTEAGEPKLLDFGIAKLLGDDDDAAGLTGTGAQLMTPEYAAPEQLRGEPVTTATDVYALGLVLYQLLCGRHPYRIQGATWGELERQVLEHEPPRPSTLMRQAASDVGGAADLAPEAVGRARGVNPQKLRRQLAGDLDTLVLKALAKDPARRYASVQQLADDLRRYLAGHPLAARPDHWLYRTRKFVRRHRLAVAAASLSGLVLLGASTAIAVQSRSVARERDTAEQVSGFLVELFSVSDPRVSRGEALSARQVLDQGAARIDRELAEQPEIRARLLNAVGLAYRGLGLYDAALAPLDSALAIRRRLYQGDHRDVAESLRHLGWVERERGEFSDAEAHYREALAMRRRLFGRFHSDVVQSTNDVGLVLRSRGEFREAEQVYREALAIGSRVFSRPHIEQSFTNNGLGVSVLYQDRPAEAEPHLREALRLLRETAGPGHPNEAINLGNLGRALTLQGKFEDAEMPAREAVAMARRLLGEDHPQYAAELTGLALLLRRTGRLPEAEATYREILDIQRRTLSAGHRRFMVPLASLTAILLDSGRAAEAEPFLRELLAVRRLHLKPGDPQIADAQSALGESLAALGRFGEAEPLLREGYDALREAAGEEHGDTQKARQRLVTFHEASGRPAKRAY
jgi:eukaryotic-like serine/threonine-protein kinase